MQFLIFLLLFFLSWLGGLFILLASAFFAYEFLSVVDITSFAVFLFGACLFLLPCIYLPVLTVAAKKIYERQILYFPLLLALVGNLPVYFLIWYKMYDLYGRSEAILFFAGFFTIAIIFGTGWAWKRKWLEKTKATTLD